MQPRPSKQIGSFMEVEGLALLPARPRNSQSRLKPPLLKKKKCLTNYYPIIIRKPADEIYQYLLVTKPTIPDDSHDLMNSALRSIRPQLKEMLGMFSLSNRLCWGSKKNQRQEAIRCDFQHDEIGHTITVIPRLTKIINQNKIIKEKNGEQIMFQLLNSQIKQIMKDNNFNELTPRKYFLEKIYQTRMGDLKVMRGYNITLSCIKMAYNLRIDICSRVFCSQNLLQDLQKKSKDFGGSLVGKTVITNYGRRRTYKILSIRKDMNPFSTFILEKEKKEVTYAQYYFRKYGQKILNEKQPMVETVLRVQQPTIDNKKVKNEVRGFLVPELIHLTGIREEIKNDYSVMKELTPYTKPAPQNRVKQTNKIIDVLNHSGTIRIEKAVEIDTYQLKIPDIRYGNFIDKLSTQNDPGQFNVRYKLRDIKGLSQWIIVYSIGRNPREDERQKDILIDSLRRSSQQLHFKVPDPASSEACESSLSGFKDAIQNGSRKSKNCQIFVLFLNKYEEKFYASLKQFITTRLKIPSQVIRKYTLEKKNKTSIMGKILIQINQKIGGTAWQVIPSVDYGLRDPRITKGIACGGLSISKGQKGFTLSFSGSIDHILSNYYNFNKLGYPKKEDFPESDLYSMFKHWLQQYTRDNRRPPGTIIVYRQGLSIPQIKIQVQQEIKALHKAIDSIRKRLKQASYMPEIAYLIVNTKITSRFYELTRNSVYNPSSGTVVFDELETNGLYDFYLTPQRVTQGTCTPIHVIVAYTSRVFDQEDLAQFTYEQCFGYYNWSGAVKLPAALQNANKLGKFMGQVIKKDFDSKQLSKSYFYL